PGGGRGLGRLLGDAVEGGVEDALGGGLLAVPHHGVDELFHQARIVDRVGGNFTLFDMSFARHVSVLGLGALGAVLGAGLLAVGDADRVHGAAHDVVADAGQVLDATAADEDDRVLLQVVSDAGDVGGHLDAVGEANAGHLAQGGVRLFRRLGVDAGAYPALLRTRLQ